MVKFTTAFFHIVVDITALHCDASRTLFSILWHKKMSRQKFFILWRINKWNEAFAE